MLFHGKKGKKKKKQNKIKQDHECPSIPPDDFWFVGVWCVVEANETCHSTIMERTDIDLALLLDDPPHSLPDIAHSLGRCIIRHSARPVHARLDQTAPPGEVRVLVGEQGATDVALGVVPDHVDGLDGVSGVGLGLSVVLLKDLLGVLVGDGRGLAAGPGLQLGFALGGCGPDAL